MAQKHSEMTHNQLSLDTIERTAIDTSGSLGSFYDAYQDHVREQRYPIDVKPSSELIKKTQCFVKDGLKDDNANFLQLIKINEELRLSILFDLAPRTGVAAVIDYPYSVSKYTRILCYTFIHRMEQFSEKIEKSEKSSKSSLPKANVTHIVTGIRYGIHVVIVLQLPPDNDTAKRIHDVLQKIANSLNQDQKTLTLDADEKELLGKTTNIMVCSNISDLTTETTVFGICSFLAGNKENFINTPIIYTLRPIKKIDPQYTASKTLLVSIPSKIIEKAEHYFVQPSNQVSNLKQSLDVDVFTLLCGHLEKNLRDRQRELLHLKNERDTVIKQIKQLIIDVRRGVNDACVLDQNLDDKNDKKWYDAIQQLANRMNALREKGQWITYLKQQGFEYCNVSERNVKKKDNEQTLLRKLIKDEEHVRILCCNDKLRTTNRSKLNQLCNEFVANWEINRNLRLIYADFDYCLYPLTDMKLLSATKKQRSEHKKTSKTFAPSKDKKSLRQPSKDRKTCNRSSTEKKTSVPASAEKTTPRPPTPPTPPRSPPSLTSDEFINILLLGETGVGKSTFINAFVNYLTSKTFQQAQSNEPVVLIPVSFLLTVGANFEERTVKFGDFDGSHSEDFEHPGESVTQHCKSYEFHLNREDGKKFRIIDTPGFGDTRGVNQDDLNMQDILEYINNLTHLNAVCFLLKPNTSEIHTFFRMCFTKLIDLLGPSVRENIIFCFTNARSTFYSPGDTAPLLKAMLKSLSLNDIPFKRENTYCFDNEAFRYLVALQNSVEFSELDRNEYENSWSKSADESNRLIDYICKCLQVCPMHDDRKSIKHAQIEIVLMIRPMLEAMRNILRNIILCRMESPNKSIKLFPKAIHRPGAICLQCPPYPIRIGNFWIVREITHEFQKKCLDCSCLTDQHVPINYVLNFEDSDNPINYRQKEMINMVHGLCLAGAEFDYFLGHITHSSKGDLFWTGLARMIVEEDNLRQNQKPNRLNSELFKHLNDLKFQYEEHIENFKSNPQQIALPNIYKTITAIREYPMIQDQIDAVKETQNMWTEPYETSQD